MNRFGVGMGSIFLTLLISSWIGIQSDEPSIVDYQQLETELIALREATVGAQTDQERRIKNQAFLEALQNALADEASFQFPFEALPHMAVLTASDKLVRIFNWNVALDNDTHEYFGLIQYWNKKRKQYVITELSDASDRAFTPEFKVYPPTEWYGALYYEIIPVSKGGKLMYTLLGWDGHTRFTTKKVIDVLTIDGRGRAKFGATIFRMEKKTQRRVIFEYSADVTMSMKYVPKRLEIIFDHLAPSRSDLEGIYEFYGPDMSYDALVLKNGKWVYIKDVDITGKKASRKHRLPPAPIVTPEDQ